MNTQTLRFMGRIALLLIGLSLTTAINLTVPHTVRAAPGVLYAAPTAQGSSDCSSWANACTLQTALARAVSGDEIWVKAGVHYPGAAGNRGATFTLKNGVALYGGFVGTETSRDQRNWQTNKTILSGDIDGDDTNNDGNFIAENTGDIEGDNAYHVVTGSGTDVTAVLDGFIITAGRANGGSLNDYGGGMYNNSGSPTLANITFSGNSALYDGGGMYNNNNSIPTLTNVTFSGNGAGFYGGGMYNNNSSPTLTNVTFSSNSASSGGGIYNYSHCSPTLTNVTFSSNSVLHDGGGIYNYESSNPMLTNVTFSSNEAGFYGGGMYNRLSSPSLSQVTFSNNYADVSGGGMFNDNQSNPTLTGVTFKLNTASDYGAGMLNQASSPQLINVTFSQNNAYLGLGGGMANLGGSNPTLINGVFYGNAGVYYGGGIFNDSSNPTLVNVTFSNNSVMNDSGGGISNLNSSPTLTNVILWGDSAPSHAEIYNAGSSNPLVSYSDVQGGYSGAGNINADPKFVGGSDLRLQLTSPAIDAGNNAAVPAGVTTDLGGASRFADVPAIPDTGSGTAPIVDMGAYEAFPVLFAAPTAQGSGTCYTWNSACTLRTALTRAVNGQEIWVRQGVHYPGAARTDTFRLTNGVAVYGGFSGGETLRDQRNWQTNVTILSGDIDGNDTNTDGNFIAETWNDLVGNNAYHVVTGSGTDNTTVLDGFIITAGYANGASSNDSGAGMFNDNGRPTLNNLTFSGNRAAFCGVMYNNNSNPILTNVTLRNNLAYLGGGLYNYNSSPTLTNVTFSGNSAIVGGGMINFRNSSTLINVTFSGNSAADIGGGMYNETSNPTLTNVTFGGNSASFDGGGMYNNDSNPTLVNSILWGNTASNGAGIYNDSSTPTISYSDIQGCGGSGSWNAACGTDGGGNIEADPRFVDAANGNLRLAFGSPAIDTGTNTGCSSTDLDSLPRPTDGGGDGTTTCDMGAYEAGTMICGVSAGNNYTFGGQSNVNIFVGIQGGLACLYVDEMGLNHPHATTGLQTGRYWLIRGLQNDKSSNATGFEVALTLPTTFTPDANDKVCRYTGNGQVWDCAASDYTGNTITRNGVIAFSDWAAGDNVGLTAITLLRLSAHVPKSQPAWLILIPVLLAGIWLPVRQATRLKCN